MKPLVSLLACLLLPLRLVTAEAPASAWQPLPFDGSFSAWRKPVGAWFITDAAALDSAKTRFLQQTNGSPIHENVEVAGPTRGGYEPEKATGPLRLQGDHGPVAASSILNQINHLS